MIKIIVEFTGVAQRFVGQKEIRLELEENTIYRDIIRIIGKRYPGLIGILIDTDGETFLSSNMFIINGDMTTPAMVMNESPRSGDRLILMSLITGG